MPKSGDKRQVQFRVSDLDAERLDTLCDAFEMNRGEVMRFYIRQAYSALGERKTDIHNAQMGLFPLVMADGKTPVPLPIAAKPGVPAG
jgi:hypothetical protein